MGDRLATFRGLRCGAIVLGTVLTLVSAPAQAGGRATRTMPVFVNVSNACRLATNTLNFGLVTTNVKTVRASTTMTVTCTPGTIYTVGIDNGQNYDLTAASRQMHNNQANGVVFYAPYQLYRDALYSLPWGTGVTGGATGVLLTGSQTLTVYGEAQLKNVKSSGYIDTVTVVLDF